MTIRSATELLTLIENELGVLPPGHGGSRPRWKVTSIMAARIKREMDKRPNYYTFAHLELAVAYLAKNRVHVTSPMAVFHYVPDALEKAAAPDSTRPITHLIEAAIEWENTTHNPGWMQWRDRLARASGPARVDTYAEWRDARGR